MADPRADPRLSAQRCLVRAAIALIVSLIGIKAYHLGLPRSGGVTAYLWAVAAISYADAVFVTACWAITRLVLTMAGGGRLAPRLIAYGFVAFAAFCCVYAVVNVVLFGILGGFLTYPLLAIIGDMRMVRSSIGAHLTPATVVGLIGIPCTYLAAVVTLNRVKSPGSRWLRTAPVAALSIWTTVGHYAYVTDFDRRADRRVAESPYWAMTASTWQAVTGRGFVRMAEAFAPDDLADFDPPTARKAKTASLSSRVISRARAALDVRATAARRPPNVILIVLESVAARWTGLHNPIYETTPILKTEAARSAVVDNFYAHIGRSSNSMVAMLLSTYPKLDFRELTEQYPEMPGTSLASMFRSRGYQTAFVTPSDMQWAGWRGFLGGHGFDSVWDYRDLACENLVSSWGVEDRCMVDKMVDFIGAAGTKPFFVTAWTTQTHHPYEPSPGVPELDLLREQSPDDWDLGRYLNVIHETDRNLARIFESVRQGGPRAGHADRDHRRPRTGVRLPARNLHPGAHGLRRDVHVPLMFWYPRMYRTPVRAKTVGSHVDLAPTIAELIGVPAAPDWTAAACSTIGIRTAPTSTWRKIISGSRSARRTGSTSTACATAETSCTIWTPIRWNSTTSPKIIPLAAIDSGSGSPRGPRRTAGSTNASMP
jgi:phosphoglycerol transferase MdoB-like AlkP superfamily enzyme